MVLLANLEELCEIWSGKNDRKEKKKENISIWTKRLKKDQAKLSPVKLHQ